MNYVINYPRFEWNTTYLIEQIYLSLISALEKNDGNTRKYEKRARWLIRRFNLWDPSPEFIVYRHDLSKRICQELAQLKGQSPKILDYVMTRALEMIFEFIEETEEEIFNRDYYLFLVKRHKRFRWRFDGPEDNEESDPDSRYNIKFPIYNNNGITLEKNQGLLII